MSETETNTDGILNWTTTLEDGERIYHIMERAYGSPLWTVLVRHLGGYERYNLIMDITACHLNGNPLDLQAMLEGDAVDFIHDVTGIVGHIDRGTGKLLDCFVPRFTKRG